jgi:hypothetical protein
MGKRAYLVDRLFLRVVSNEDKGELRIGQTRPADRSVLDTRLQRIVIKDC